MTAHIAGLPFEELFPAAGGAATGLLAVRCWILVRLRRRGVR